MSDHVDGWIVDDAGVVHEVLSNGGDWRRRDGRVVLGAVVYSRPEDAEREAMEVARQAGVRAWKVGDAVEWDAVDGRRYGSVCGRGLYVCDVSMSDSRIFTVRNAILRPWQRRPEDESWFVGSDGEAFRCGYGCIQTDCHPTRWAAEREAAARRKEPAVAVPQWTPAEGDAVEFMHEGTRVYGTWDRGTVAAEGGHWHTNVLPDLKPWEPYLDDLVWYVSVDREVCETVFRVIPIGRTAYPTFAAARRALRGEAAPLPDGRPFTGDTVQKYSTPIDNAATVREEPTIDASGNVYTRLAWTYQTAGWGGTKLSGTVSAPSPPPPPPSFAEAAEWQDAIRALPKAAPEWLQSCRELAVMRGVANESTQLEERREMDSWDAFASADHLERERRESTHMRLLRIGYRTDSVQYAEAMAAEQREVNDAILAMLRRVFAAHVTKTEPMAIVWPGDEP